MRRAAAVLWVAGSACCLSAMEGGEPWRAAALVGTSLAVGAVVRRHLRLESRHKLRFDGQQWSISGSGPTRYGRMRVCLDFQSSMLLRLSLIGRQRRWLWVESRADHGAWRDLRRAVYSRAPTVGDGGEPGHAPEAGSPPTASR